MTERGTVKICKDCSGRAEYYVVLDDRFESVVIITHFSSIAQYWKKAVDYYKHNKPYNIRAH